MDLGISMACEATAAPGLAQRAEAAGFDRVWTTEFYDRSAIVPLAAMAATTASIGLGTAVAYAFARRPLLLAAEALDVDALSGGRLIMGLGTGERTRMRDWFGIDPREPAARMRELVDLLGQLWHVGERPVVHDGRHFSVRVTPVPGAAVPSRRAIPVYVAAFGPRMAEVAGAVADGILCHPFATPRYFHEVIQPRLTVAAQGAGRHEGPKVAWMPITTVAERPEVARREAAAQIAFYGQFQTFDRIFALHGFSEPVSRLRAAASQGDWREMISAVTEEMIDTFTLSGTASEVRDRFEDRRWHDAVILHTPSTMYYRPEGSGIAEGRYQENIDGLLDTFGRR